MKIIQSHNKLMNRILKEHLKHFKEIMRTPELLIEFKKIKEFLLNLTHCYVCRKCNVSERFIQNKRIISFCNKCLYSKNHKTLDAIYSDIEIVKKQDIANYQIIK